MTVFIVLDITGELRVRVVDDSSTFERGNMEASFPLFKSDSRVHLRY